MVDTFRSEWMMKSRPEAGSCTVRRTTTTRFAYRTYMLCVVRVPSYCCARAITLSYAGPNTFFVFTRTTKLLLAYDKRQNKRACESQQCIVMMVIIF